MDFSLSLKSNRLEKFLGSSKFWCKRVDLLSLKNNCLQSFRYTRAWIRFGRLEALTQSMLCLVDKEKPNS